MPCTSHASTNSSDEPTTSVFRLKDAGNRLHPKVGIISPNCVTLYRPNNSHNARCRENLGTVINLNLIDLMAIRGSVPSLMQ